MDDVHCSGSESKLIDCSHSGIGVHNCGYYDGIAGVKCIGKHHSIIVNMSVVCTRIYVVIIIYTDISILHEM